MKSWVLKIRKEDVDIFNMIKSGVKSVETRAATKEIQANDKVIFVWNGEKLEKKVVAVRKYADFEDYLEKEDLTKVFGPNITKVEAKRIHFSFPGYKEKLEKHGIIAFDLQ